MGGFVVGCSQERIPRQACRTRHINNKCNPCGVLSTNKKSSTCFGSGTHAAIAAGGGRKGERIVLFTTNSQADRNALREYLLQEGHSGLSVPAEIIRLEKMPLLGTGKPDYLGLQQQAEQAIAGEKP